MDAQDIAQILVTGAMQGVVYALLAMGIAIVYRTTRVLNFAHGELMVAGVFVMYVLVTYLHVPYGVACLVALAVSAVLGTLLYLVAVKGAAWLSGVVVTLVAGWLASTKVGAVAWLAFLPLAVVLGVVLARLGIQALRGTVGWVLGTIAFATIVQEGLVALVGSTQDRLPIPGPFSELGSWKPGGVVVPLEYVATAIVGIVVLVAVDLLEGRTRFGRAMKAVAYDPDAAALMGVDVNRVIYAAFALAACTATLAGFLVTPILTARTTDGPGFTIVALTAALLGGIDRVRGAAIGGLLLGFVEVLLGRALDATSRAVASGSIPLESLRNALVLVLLILVLVARPRGLFGTPTAERA